MILGMLLLRYFRTKPVLASIFACLCAFEPLQLMAERFMTETFATFGFALYLWTALSFLRSKQLSTLIAVQALGVVLISLRYSFMPLILILSVALPILAGYKGVRFSWRPLLVRLAVAIVTSQMLLAGYRHLYGFLAHTKPAYLSGDGEFLVADMALSSLPKISRVPVSVHTCFRRSGSR